MKTMAAKYKGACKDCGAEFPVGTTIKWSRATGAVCADGCEYDAEAAAEARYFDRQANAAEVRGFYDDDPPDWEDVQARRDEADYQRGYHEVAQIQAFAPAGSALRDQMYAEMEMAAYNRGEDY